MSNLDKDVHISNLWTRDLMVLQLGVASTSRTHLYTYKTGHVTGVHKQSIYSTHYSCHYYRSIHSSFNLTNMIYRMAFWSVSSPPAPPHTHNPLQFEMKIVVQVLLDKLSSVNLDDLYWVKPWSMGSCRIVLFTHLPVYQWMQIGRWFISEELVQYRCVSGVLSVKRGCKSVVLYMCRFISEAWVQKRCATLYLWHKPIVFFPEKILLTSYAQIFY